MKGFAQHRKAMEYTLNQWTSLVGYRERGDAAYQQMGWPEKAKFRPFGTRSQGLAVSLITPQGATGRATCYSLIETAKANNLDPFLLTSNMC